MRFTASSGQWELFTPLLLETLGAYHKYGATAKVQQLQVEFSSHLIDATELLYSLGVNAARVSSGPASIASRDNTGTRSAEEHQQQQRDKQEQSLSRGLSSSRSSSSTSSSLSSTSSSQTPPVVPLSADGNGELGFNSSGPQATSASSDSPSDSSHSPSGPNDPFSLLADELLNDNSAADESGMAPFHHESRSGGTSSFADFDLRTVIKATQAITREVEVNRLLSTLLDIALRSCGAQRAILFTVDVGRDTSGQSNDSDAELVTEGQEETDGHTSQHHWQIEAYSTSDVHATYVRDVDDTQTDRNIADESTGKAADGRPQLRNLSALLRHASFSSPTAPTAASPLSTAQSDSLQSLYPTTVMNYVLHSKQPLMLADASTEKLFRRDPYIVAHGVKSVMCIPLLHSGRLVSCLYLDNTATTNLFSRERLLVCRLVMQQASISRDNARLYSRLASACVVAGAGHSTSNGGERRQVVLPGEHVSRDPHAYERRHRRH